MRIGIFGGTFDPPHLGHLILAAEAVDSLQLDKMLWVLTPDPPHKQSQMISPAEDRMAMTKRMVECSPSFEFSDIEFRRPGPHYALDTVNALRLENPGSELFYVIGGDSLRDIPTWHKPTEFILACDHILVMQRPGSTPDLTILYKNYPELKTRLEFLDVPLIEISAVNIRQRVKQQRAYWQFVIPPVYQIIEERGLYL